MFLSQLPYVPLGDLRAVVSYPAEGGRFSDDEIRSALDTVSLGHLGSRLDEVADWAKILSPGEQQRIAFARVLLAKPKVVFLDEVDVRARRRSGVRAVPSAAHASCPTASWSASVIVPRSNSTTTGGSSCSATAVGGSRRSRPAPRVFRRGDRRTSLRPTGFRSNSPCRPARCSTRTPRRRTTQESSSRLRAALRRRSRRSVRPW